MRKKLIGLLGICLLAVVIPTVAINAQEKPVEKDVAQEKPYDPKADAQKDIDGLIAKAKKEKKNIVIQAGGNWCVWCLRFNDYIHQTKSVADLIKDNYVYYHLNYSPENKNEAVFNKYAPGKGKEFGYPFFIVMDATGKVLTVRESGNLESGASYDETKVLAFFKEWLPKKK